MDATATLADTLLDDLADLSDGEEENDQIRDTTHAESHYDNHNKEHTVLVGSMKMDSNQQDDEKQNHITVKGSERKTDEFQLENKYLEDRSLHRHMSVVRKLQDKQQRDSTKPTTSNEEEEDDYDLIVESNRFRTKLSDELHRAHGALCQVYGKKFPELEELLSSAPIPYKTAVQVIQNEMDLTLVNDKLNLHFSSNQIITMTVASSTTEGRPLGPDELSWCLQVASYMDEIDAQQTELTNFVEQRIRGLAPSLCALIGPQVTAQLVGLAGGLSELALIPACNLQVLGQMKATASSRAGFSSSAPRMASNGPTSTNVSSVQPMPQYAHEGVLIQSDLFRTTTMSPQHRTKLLKQVASKVALCARCDAVNVQQGRPRTAAPGEKYRQEILTKLDQWQHPQDAAAVKKALPKPDLTVKKRRGGKRMRRLKERFEETALMKQANTRSFSSAAGEYGDDAMGITLGLLDTEGGGMDGSVRKNATGEKRPMRMANTKAARKQRALAARVSQQHNQQQQQVGGTSGLASTVAFTPLQAMELVNPDAQRERVRQANQKWFADTAGFQSALPPKNK